MSGIRISVSCGVLALGAYSPMLKAQVNPRADLAITYTAEHGNPVGGGDFWLHGGSAEVGITAWRGFALAGNFTGSYNKAFGPSGIPLGLLAYTAGPRYRLTPGSKTRLSGSSIFGEALFGGVHGFNSIFPAQSGQYSTANAFAMQLGGGIDLKLNSRFAVRAFEADWLRMRLPNSTTNTQNDLRLSAGIVLRFGRPR